MNKEKETEYYKLDDENTLTVCEHTQIRTMYTIGRLRLPFSIFVSKNFYSQSRLEKCQNYATLELKDAAEQWWWTSHTYSKTHTHLSTTKTLIHRQQGCPLISRSVKCALSWRILKMKWIFVKIYRMKYPIEKKIFKCKRENCSEFFECFIRIQMFLCYNCFSISSW